MGKLSFGSTGYAYSITEHKFDQSDVSKCSRCKQKVFLIEQQKAGGKIWHKKCLTCGKCNKSLQSSNALSHQGDIFCSPCHKRVSAVSGPVYPGTSTTSPPGTQSTTPPGSRVSHSNDYGIDEGDRALKNESQRRSSAGVISNRPVKKMNFSAPPGVNDKCPVCGKRVYFAEELKAHKKNWHKSCFKCVTCQKTLIPGRSNEHGNHLYCQPCYSKQYGPKGYSSGGNQSLSVDDREHIESEYNRSHHYSDSSYDSEEMYVIHRKNDLHSNVRCNQEGLRQEDSIRVSNEPIREEDYEHQTIREEDYQHQPIRAEEFKKQPIHEQQINKHLVSEEQSEQNSIIDQQDYQKQSIGRTDEYIDRSSTNTLPQKHGENRNSQYNNRRSVEEGFQDMNLNNNNNNVDEVFNDIPQQQQQQQQQQYYNNENVQADHHNASNGNYANQPIRSDKHSNESITQERYSNEPIRKERYSNEPIRRERYSNNQSEEKDTPMNFPDKNHLWIINLLEDDLCPKRCMLSLKD